MLDAISSVVGMFVSILGYASHIIIVLFRNLLLIGFIVAVLWGLFTLSRRSYRYLRGMRGEELEHGRPRPKGKPEDSSV
jgi:hypothetical protein